jgi:nitroimidazol reductase NimA-like FMN-containing flavoprotein (pyridoxamine 5'-phosphate oxidase superfamily)
MFETDGDVERLQILLDWSYAAAGPHLREVITPDRRLSASCVCDVLTGMRLLALATVTSDQRPVVVPVDGVFYRGAFHFGSTSDALRIAHIRRNPAVSATHLPGEELAVTVHGKAIVLDMKDPSNSELRGTVLDIYTPQYGLEWRDFFDSIVYVRIDAERMFTFNMT